MTYDELVEKVARAIMHDEDTYRVGGEEYCETIARIAISTVFAALQEPTEAMHSEGRTTSNYLEVWNTMLAASPLEEKKG